VGYAKSKVTENRREKGGKGGKERKRRVHNMHFLKEDIYVKSR
jgi:hypothetical protein